MIEHAFPLTGFVGLSAHATFSGRGGIMSSSLRPTSDPGSEGLPMYLPIGQVLGRDFSEGKVM